MAYSTANRPYLIVPAVAGGAAVLTGSFAGTVGIGFHFIQALEVVQAATVVTFIGDGGLAIVQSGLTVLLEA